MERYGKNEWLYALPIATALASDQQFRQWFISMTPFSSHATVARLLWEEQKAGRTKGSETWWRSYWTGSSYQYRAECAERKTDLLAIFEVPSGFRFALHVEVKAPGDSSELNRRETTAAEPGVGKAEIGLLRPSCLMMTPPRYSAAKGRSLFPILRRADCSILSFYTTILRANRSISPSAYSFLTSEEELLPVWPFAVFIQARALGGGREAR